MLGESKEYVSVRKAKCELDGRFQAIYITTIYLVSLMQADTRLQPIVGAA
jgi:hypothetical protein